MTKVLLLVPTLSHGGAEKIVSLISRGLKEFDISIALLEEKISYPFRGTLYNLGIGYSQKHNFLGKVMKVIIGLKRIHQLKNEENFDEVFLKLNTLLLEYKLYEALPIELKKYLKSLKAVHDMGAFRNNYTKNEPIGTAHKLNEGHQKFGSSIHPIVKTHPITKKNYIYI